MQAEALKKGIEYIWNRLLETDAEECLVEEDEGKIPIAFDAVLMWYSNPNHKFGFCLIYDGWDEPELNAETAERLIENSMDDITRLLDGPAAFQFDLIGLKTEDGFGMLKWHEKVNPNGR